MSIFTDCHRHLAARIATAILAVSFLGAATPEKLIFGYTPVSETVSAYAAKGEGIFAKHGLDTQMLLLNSSAVLTTSMVAGSVDIGSITPAVFLQAVDGGLDLVAVAGAASSAHAQRVSAVMVPTNSTIHTAKDFIGKRIAVAAIHSALHIQFLWWLTQQGVDPKKVTFLESPYSTQADLLRSGRIDAVVTSEPYLTRLTNAKAGTPVTYLSDMLPENTIMVIYVATRDWANKHPQAVLAFRQSIVEGIQVSADQGTAEKYIAQYLKLPPEAVKSTTHSRLDEKVTAAQLQWWADTMRAQGLLRTKLDTAKLIAK